MPDQPNTATTAAPAAAPAAAAASEETQRLIVTTEQETGEVADKLTGLFDITEEKDKERLRQIVDDILMLVLQGQTVPGDLIKRINYAIAWIDKRLSDMGNAVNDPQ